MSWSRPVSWPDPGNLTRAGWVICVDCGVQVFGALSLVPVDEEQWNVPTLPPGLLQAAALLVVPEGLEPLTLLIGRLATTLLGASALEIIFQNGFVAVITVILLGPAGDAGK